MRNDILFYATDRTEINFKGGVALLVHQVQHSGTAVRLKSKDEWKKEKRGKFLCQEEN